MGSRNGETLCVREQVFVRRAAPVCDSWDELKEAFDLQFPHRSKTCTCYRIYAFCKRDGTAIKNPNATPPVSRKGHRGANPERAVWVAWMIEEAPKHHAWTSLTEAFNEHFGTGYCHSSLLLMVKRAGVQLSFAPGMKRWSKKEDREKAKAPKAPKRPYGSTLCEFCVHAVPNHGPRRALEPGEEAHGCNWSMYLEPVGGWRIKKNPNAQDRFRVVSCPQFVDDRSWLRGLL